jgi:hypothetical protein
MRQFFLSLISCLTACFCLYLVIALPVQAGCVVPDLCDATGPGDCSNTCNGGKPCTINNGWVTTCQWTCTCDTTFESCSIKGGLCGTSGTTYSGTDYGICGGEDGSLCVQDCSTSSTQCFETIIKPCCIPGEPAPSASPSTPSEWCGNGSCNASAGENQTTCSTDCGSPPNTCGNGSCAGGENCSTCSADCGSCPPTDSCGNGSCGTSESCGSCPSDCGSCLTCGNGTCNASESCSTCAADCGACPDSCGDGACTGFETCGSCAADCGICYIEGNQPWWQTSTGHVYAGTTSGTALESQIFTTYCISPDCIAQLITPDSTLLAESEGVAITGGGDILTNGFTSSANTEVIGSRPTRFLENYDFFYRNSNLGLDPVNDFAGQEGDIQKPTATKEAYFHRGNVTLQSLWTVNSGESYTIFIDGNLTISDPSNLNQLTDVAEGGFLAFIVSGDITIAESVGNETLTDTTSNLEGIFVADGALTIETRGEDVGDDRFIGEGSFISWTQVNIDRNYSDGGSRAEENQDKPTETFTFRPDFVKNTPEFLTRPHSIWQESN